MYTKKSLLNNKDFLHCIVKFRIKSHKFITNLYIIYKISI